MLTNRKDFDALLGRLTTTIGKIFPISGELNTLSVSNLRWTGTDPEVFDDPELHKKYKTTGKTLGAKLLGDVTITSKQDHKVLDSSKGHPIMVLPHLTNKQSYIVQGKEVQVINQIRLKPGTYTRYTADNNVETFINAAGGGYRVQLDRVSKIFRLRIGQTTYVYLYPVLKALGVDDTTLRRIWGDDIYGANKMYDSPGELGKLYKKMRPFAPAIKDPQELARVVGEYFKSKALDPDITKLTLGAAYTNIEPKVLVASAERALRLARGEIKADDTENIAYKSLHSVDDFVIERVLQTAEMVAKTIKYVLDRHPTVVDVLPPSLFTKPIMSFFTVSEFARYSDQNNPLDMVSVQSSVTSMGEGGISSVYAVSDRLRALHPSHVGIVDPVQTPESQKIGIVTHLSLGSRKIGNDLGQVVINVKTGAKETKKAADLESVAVAFYDEYDHSKGKPRPKADLVKGRVDGELRMIPAKQVAYLFDKPMNSFGFVANSVPFLNTNSPNRVLMGSQHISQAVPLKDPDVPSVQAKFGAKGYESSVGRFIVPQAPSDGTIVSVTKNLIVFRGSDGKVANIKLHDHYPLNSSAFLDEHPIVQPGQKVKKGDPLADSDFTRNGELAIGKTLKVGFIPYKGWNFEDGLVVSESASKKLTSVHKHELSLNLYANVKVGLSAFLAHFPQHLEKVDRSKYGPDGIVKKGAVLNTDEVAIPAVREIKVYEEFEYSKIHKSLKSQWQDVSVYWDGSYPATVVDVVKTKSFITAYAKTEDALEVGDKLSVRHGGKGIVANIIPDKEMYRNEKGEVIDVLFNPAGVLGRANPGAYLESSAGAIAAKTGKPYLVENFSGRDNLQEVQDRLRAEGMNENGTETLIDPTTNQPVHNIKTGDLYFLKLRHQVSKKMSARGITSYTHDESPSRSDKANPMAIGSMELYSLLSGGGTAFLRDATTIKGQRNDEFWNALQMGLPTPPPKTPFVVDKFVTYMKGAGINIKQDGTQIKALPLTDKDILGQSNGEISSPGVVKADDLSAEPGGLFDRGLTGGFAGVSWNHITLADPIPNPLMDHAIIAVLSTPAKPFKKSDFDKLLNGTSFVTPDGRIVTDPKGNKTGGEAIKQLLHGINIQHELLSLRAVLPSLKGAKKDIAVKKIRYLQVLKNLNMSAVDAYVNTHIPVIPAKMRPIYPNPDGTLNVSDPVHGYREVLMINNQIKDLKGLGVDDQNLAPLRSQLYSAVRGLVGLQEPLTRSENFKGFIATIKGEQNKFGLFQGRVIKRRQDLSGRSTIIPDPRLGMDDVKIPIEMAFTIYKPFIVQRLVQYGQSPIAARKLVEEKDPLALTALENVLKERPVLLNRAPSLHKFSIMSFKPQLTQGKAIEINPLVVNGFNADFDGDAMQVHIPVSEEARHEAMTKLMPSQNLLSPRNDSVMHAPTKEMILGIYLMTTPKGEPIPVKSLSDAVTQYRSGKIKVNQAVKVGGRVLCPGQGILNEVLPLEARPEPGQVDRKKMLLIIGDVIKKKPTIAGDVISKIKDLGNHYVTEIGWSFGLNDLKFPKDVRDAVVAEAAKGVKSKDLARIFGAAAAKMEMLVTQNKDNRLVMAGPLSGAFGKGDMITQMVASPIAVKDHEGNVTKMPIPKGYAEGLDMGSYWALIPGSRRGLMDRTLSTADTGAFGKSLVAATIDTTISMMDCGTKEGIALPLDNADVLDRVVASGPYAGKTVDSALVRTLKAKGKGSLVVRSPLHCRAHRGICALCFGLLENGRLPSIGYHIGTLAGQTIAEPATQLTMKNFHTGGAVGGTSLGFARIKQILEMPTNVKGKASIAMAGGKVVAADPSAAGGWNVRVGTVDHFVPQELGLGVSVGQQVKAGDMLSTGGAVRPQDILAATNDIRAVQDHMIKDITQVFANANIKVKRKIFETVLQPLTSRVEVTDPGDAAIKFGVMPGDVVSIANVDSMNAELKKAGKNPITYVPTLLSTKQAPHYANDFIGQLIADRPHQTLKMAPALAATSNIGPDGHPIATYAFGRFFNTKVKENLRKAASVDDLLATMKEAVIEPAGAITIPEEVQVALRGVQEACGRNGNSHE